MHCEGLGGRLEGLRGSWIALGRHCESLGGQRRLHRWRHFGEALEHFGDALGHLARHLQLRSLKKSLASLKYKRRYKKKQTPDQPL